jgi:catechol 2,3-dioxygenase-like lactoylglutathione lyase family enzyme
VTTPAAESDVVTLRPFLPANDFEKSLQFYVDLGFTARRMGSDLASLDLGPFGFLLQKYDATSYAQHLMLSLMVNDLDAWWRRIESLDLATKFGVPAPQPPALQPWGLTIVYVVDPTGILWHIAQNPNR